LSGLIFQILATLFRINELAECGCLNPPPKGAQIQRNRLLPLRKRCQREREDQQGGFFPDANRVTEKNFLKDSKASRLMREFRRAKIECGSSDKE
jgi:hypothetical protein